MDTSRPWAEEVFYQFYPLGFCGADFENNGICHENIKKVIDWIPHLQKLGISAVYFSPIFESDTHGYNTRDYTKIDSRLGTNEDFAEVVSALHDADIRVIIDGVFNHVGRGFWAFRDVLEKREASPYVGWFSQISFEGNSNYNDGLWYEGWEGCYDLVKLNLRNEDVINHIFDAIRGWVSKFDIDGLRLDVAYCLDHDFIRRLRGLANEIKPNFFLLGETLHGDYNQIMNDGMLHSVTNYECYKGLYSSFNSMNMFEINHSLMRQFGADPWCLYTGKHLLAFADNHDVSRVASILSNENHIPLIYTLVFTMPGIPCVYYGSEWGEKADKSQGDPALRPCFDKPQFNDLSEHIAALAKAKHESKALCFGNFVSIVLTNEACVFLRECDGERVLSCVNAGGSDFFAGFDMGVSSAVDMLSGKTIELNGGFNMPPYSSFVLKL